MSNENTLTQEKDLSQLYAKTTPQYRILKKDDNYQVEVLLPGIEKADLEIDLNGKDLVITTNRTRENKKPNEIIMREFHPKNFELKLKVEAPIENDAISADLDNGLLKLKLPLSEKNKPRKISVN